MSNSMTSQLLSRFVRPNEPDLSPSMAQHIKAFKLTEQEQARLNELAAKSTDGTLTGDERLEYESFVLLGEFLTLMKCKAHVFLQSHSPAA
jgi:hypothetical protein